HDFSPEQRPLADERVLILETTRGKGDTQFWSRSSKRQRIRASEWPQPRGTAHGELDLVARFAVVQDVAEGHLAAAVTAKHAPEHGQVWRHDASAAVATPFAERISGGEHAASSRAVHVAVAAVRAAGPPTHAGQHEAVRQRPEVQHIPAG